VDTVGPNIFFSRLTRCETSAHAMGYRCRHVSTRWQGWAFHCTGTRTDTGVKHTLPSRITINGLKYVSGILVTPL
jgi:hypothetical protein